MKESGKVSKIRRGTVYVELKRNEKCDGCKMCAFGKQSSVVVPVKCGMDVEVGQTVTVEMPTRSVGNAALLIYAIPLLTTVVGALIGLVGEWWLQLTLAAVGLAVGLAAVIPIERIYRKKSGVLPVVVEADVGISDDKNTENGE